LKAQIRVPVGVFIPDLPLNMSGKNDTGILKFAKKLDNWLLQWLVSSVDIVYTITKEIVSNWMPKGLKFLVVEGMVPSFQVNKQFERRLNCFHADINLPKRMLYTGSFAHIKKFVLWFFVCRELNADLILVGGGPERTELESIALTDPRIIIKKFLKRNTIWNLAGSGLPLIAAACLIPLTLYRLGNEAFAVLTLLWALIGYFSLYYMGIGRALTYELSILRAVNNISEISLTLATGVLGAAVMLILAPYLAASWLKISPTLQQDAMLSFKIAATGVIPITITSVLKEAIEGLERFTAGCQRQ